MEHDTWLVMDYEAGLCTREQVGSPKRTQEQLTDDPALSASDRLKRDVITAYKAVGGPEYFRRNHDLLDKALLKIIAEPMPQTDATIRLIIDAPWMSPDRLSYQRQTPLADVVDATPAAAPEEWRTDDQRVRPGPVLIPKDEEAERLLKGPPKG